MKTFPPPPPSFDCWLLIILRKISISDVCTVRRRNVNSFADSAIYCSISSVTTAIFRSLFRNHNLNLALPPRPSANSWLRTFPSSRPYRKLAQKFNGTSGVCTDTYIVCKHLLPTSFIFIESSVVRMESANITIRHIQQLCLHRFSLRWWKDGEIWIWWRKCPREGLQVEPCRFSMHNWRRARAF